MTFIGKLFVLVNLALSLAMATLAFGVYSSGLDWSDNPAKGTQAPGKLVAKTAEIADLTKQLKLAEDSWKVARADLWAREDQRRVERVWYAAELRKLDGKAPVVMVAQEKGGEVGRPKMVPAEEAPMVSLHGREHYKEKLEEYRAENKKVREDLLAKVVEDDTLTKELTEKATGESKGLRTLLVDERAKQQGVVSEQGIVDGLRVNRLVDSELILKRLEAIEARIRELMAYMKQANDAKVRAGGP